jgi:hypothetical protein
MPTKHNWLCPTWGKGQYLHTYPFYSVDEFFMREDDLQHFCKMSAVFHIENLYMCVCMYVWLVPHPTVFMTHLCVHGINMCVCVCVGKKECTWLQTENPIAIPPKAPPTKAYYLSFHGINMWQKDSSSKILYVFCSKKTWTLQQKWMYEVQNELQKLLNTSMQSTVLPFLCM